MKKKISAIGICFLAVMLMLCVFPITAGAEEEIIVADNIQEEVADTNEEERTITIFTRIWEFLATYSTESLSVVGSAVLLILNIILKHTNSKSAKEAKKALETINGEVTKTLGGQNSVVNVVNNMIDGYNALSQNYDVMKNSYDQYGALESERNRVVGAVFATNAAILEILTTVYVNSKNLPQGVKDLVNLKYANCLKSLENDEQLVAIVEAVRNNIGATSEETEVAEANAENAEV